jgi:hypothetical protein
MLHLRGLERGETAYMPHSFVQRALGTLVLFRQLTDTPRAFELRCPHDGSSFEMLVLRCLHPQIELLRGSGLLKLEGSVLFT